MKIRIKRANTAGVYLPELMISPRVADYLDELRQAAIWSKE
jgi:hypothetical protein